MGTPPTPPHQGGVSRGLAVARGPPPLTHQRQRQMLKLKTPDLESYNIIPKMPGVQSKITDHARNQEDLKRPYNSI